MLCYGGALLGSGVGIGLLKQERESEIVRLLSQAESGILGVSHLSRLLDVSEMTIRRDLDALAAAGLVQRIHGGAMHVNSALLYERSFAERGREARPAKVAIGRAAARLVHEGQVVILDAGTTTLEIARHLTARHITAVTNALPVASELSAHPEVSAILLGGEVKGPELCTVGPMVTDSLTRMSADLLFLSTAGFSPERGLTEPDLREAEVKRAMMKAAKRVLLVADSSKFGAIYFAQTAPITAVHAVVTDDRLDPGRPARPRRDGHRGDSGPSREAARSRLIPPIGAGPRRPLPLRSTPCYTSRRSPITKESPIMKKIGFVDYSIDEWHANNYPRWIRASSMADKFQIALAWEKTALPGKATLSEWCRTYEVGVASSLEQLIARWTASPS